MERKSLSKKVLYGLIYFGSLMSALVILIGDKEADTDIKFHAYQALVLAVLNTVFGAGFVISVVFGILAMINGEAPTLPLIGDNCKEWAQK